MAQSAFPPIGTPGWVDLSSEDPEASRQFYTALFGWTVDVIADPNAGGYGMFKLNGKEVAGVGPRPHDQQPTLWNSYVLVDDAAAVTAKVKDAGGTVILEPFDVMGAGWMGVIADPSNAIISLWQPGTHHGCEVFGVPGSFCWLELNSRDIASDKLFYWTVFGWDPSESATPGYTEFKLGDAVIAGGMALPAGRPADIPSHWLVYFGVADVDAAAAKVTELGGSVIHPPEDIPGDIGRFAVAHDPQGAVFGLLTSTRFSAS
ncbi:MAG: VOC family protein [Candidatus Dormiibacterota bacterium]